MTSRAPQMTSSSGSCVRLTPTSPSYESNNMLFAGVPSMFLVTCIREYACRVFSNPKLPSPATRTPTLQNNIHTTDMFWCMRQWHVALLRRPVPEQLVTAAIARRTAPKSRKRIRGSTKSIGSLWSHAARRACQKTGGSTSAERRVPFARYSAVLTVNSSLLVGYTRT